MRKNHNSLTKPTLIIFGIFSLLFLLKIIMPNEVVNANQPLLTSSETKPLDIPSGYYLISSGIGVDLYKKDFAGGQPNFVQVIRLNQGASVQLLHGPIDSLRIGQGSFGGNDASIYKTSLTTAWNSFSSGNANAFCITNGQFFATTSDPTRLAFPLKKDGVILSDGYGSTTEYPGQLLILELWNDHANIQYLSRDSLFNSSAPNILGGLTEDANKGIYTYTGRTFAGIDDSDGNGTYETVLIFNSLYATQISAAAGLRSFGADKVIMFDGGGSTQLRCGSTNHISSSRIIPQTIGAVAGTLDSTPPITTASLSGTLGENGYYISNVIATLTASDDLSGIKSTHYNLNDTGWQTYTPPLIVTTNGRNVLQYFSIDNTNHTEATKSTAPFYIDTVLPTNPTSITTGCSITSGVWQNTCNDLYFTWTGASDATSGLAFYEYEWPGVQTTLTPFNNFDPNTVGDGIYNLNFRTNDVAGNWSNWKTMFTLKYDATSPTGSIQVKNGWEVINQALVTLNTNATDNASGVSLMRLRDAGGTWTEWLPFSSSLQWILPPQTDQTHVVEVQYQDRAGNISPVYSDAILLDIYPDHPSSQNFQLIKSTFGMSGTDASSENFSLQGTLSQESANGFSGSENYRAISGYWGWMPEWIEFFLNFLPLMMN